MSKMHVAFVLELYQPPTEDFKTLTRINSECYVPLVKLLVTEPRPRITLLVTSSLINLLNKWGLAKPVLPLLQFGIAHDNIELAHSGAYHSVFPLLSDKEVRRQIELDIEAKRKTFPPTKTRGILPPELCYRDSLIPVFKDLGFNWTLIDDKLMELHQIPVPSRSIYTVDDMAILLRSSFWSDCIRQPSEDHTHWTGQAFLQVMRQELENVEQDCYKIIMLPGETFGHHVKYLHELFFRDLLYGLDDFPDIRLCTVSDLLGNSAFPRIKREHADFGYFPASSISTRPDDWVRQDPYPHFRSRNNPIHDKLWQLTDLILEVTDHLDFDQLKFQRLRKLLDMAFYSGQYFHASYWFWDKSRVYEGIDRQMRALYEYYQTTRDKQPLRQGQDLYTDLMWEISQRDVHERLRDRGGQKAGHN